MKYSILLLLAIGLCGCGGPSGSEVAGKVTFTGGGPLPKGVVNLNGPGGSYRGMINSDGTYTISNVADGTYKVTITGAVEGGSSASTEMQYDADGNYIEPETSEPKPLIQSIYSSSDQSGLKLDVPGDYNLEVMKAE